MTYPSAGWPWAADAAPQGYDALTEHRMDIAALKERAEKHGGEIDKIEERVAALEKLKEAARRWALSLSLSVMSLLGHWQQDPLAKKASAILSGLASALK